MNLPYSEPASGDVSTAPVYRFSNVTVDVGRQQLSVDEVEVACQPLAFRLLVMLCEANGTLVPRAVLFDRLWPGGQDIGDAALTQLIWRLRGALGSAADAIRTVRRGGIRLDAELRVELAAEPELHTPVAAAPDVVLPTPVADTRQATAPRRWRIGLLIVLVAVAAALLLARVLHDPLISSEYALYASDLDASRDDTAELLRLALAAEQTADKGRSRELLQQVAMLDTQSPVAPALLAMYLGGGLAESEQWAEIARTRVREQTPAYTRLLVELSYHLRERDERVRQLRDAMLDLRPNAWRMQFALAHYHMARRAFATALAAYRRVPLDKPGPGVLVYVLSDRASLGDIDAVEAELAAGRLRNAPMLEAYVQARLAYAGKHWDEAILAADRAQALADGERAYDNAARMAELAALASYASGHSDAGERFTRLLPRCAGKQIACRAGYLGFLAIVTAQAGERELARSYLADALEAALPSWEQAALQITALQFGIASPRDTESIAKAFGPESDFAGNAELLRAWQSLADGDRAAAARQLERARMEGVKDTYFAEYALLLGARLGEKTTPCHVDPPYPNSLRLSACIELARLEQR
ncbi:MAG: winged helix-turn-helix domain-containing protein [Rhodanobacteraceae bacterium]|nr:winged helix-turn-helix domain-containing protein [Rhodanobacteraceae bacterium]